MRQLRLIARFVTIMFRNTQAAKATQPNYPNEDAIDDADDDDSGEHAVNCNDSMGLQLKQVTSHMADLIFTSGGSEGNSEKGDSDETLPIQEEKSSRFELTLKATTSGIQSRAPQIREIGENCATAQIGINGERSLHIVAENHSFEQSNRAGV